MSEKTVDEVLKKLLGYRELIIDPEGYNKEIQQAKADFLRIVLEGLPKEEHRAFDKFGTREEEYKYNEALANCRSAISKLFGGDITLATTEIIEILAREKEIIAEELTKIIQTELLPFADAKWRTDKFEFDERVMNIFAKNIVQSILSKYKVMER